MAFDWSAVDAVVEKIPAGRWASYGAVARAAGLPAQYAKALGAYLADADLEGVWRVLDGDGRPSPRFRLGELQRAGDVAEVIEWLKQEGVRFDHLGRARSHCQLDVFQLRRLLKD
jgi:alkylated DNA nucleotide flippase Atl1